MFFQDLSGQKKSLIPNNSTLYQQSFDNFLYLIYYQLFAEYLLNIYQVELYFRYFYILIEL